VYAFIVVVLALFLARKQPAPSANVAPSEDPLVERYARAVNAQNRRLDALEALLGSLAALEFAAMTYLLDKASTEPTLFRVLAAAMLLPIALALAGSFGFVGREGIDIVRFDEDVVRDPVAAERNAVTALVRAAANNRTQERWKTRLRNASTVGAAVILAVSLAYTLLHPAVVQ
jgi:hypothetical protein